MAQNFFIRKNSNLPILKLKVINDGRNMYRTIYDNLENAVITFSPAMAKQSALYCTGASIWTCQTQWMSTGGAKSRSFPELSETEARNGIQNFS